MPCGPASCNANPGSLALDKSGCWRAVITKTIPGDLEKTADYLVHRPFLPRLPHVRSDSPPPLGFNEQLLGLSRLCVPSNVLTPPCLNMAILQSRRPGLPFYSLLTLAWNTLCFWDSGFPRLGLGWGSHCDINGKGIVHASNKYQTKDGLKLFKDKELFKHKCILITISAFIETASWAPLRGGYCVYLKALKSHFFIYSNSGMDSQQSVIQLPQII